jgi:hypothetical protein
MQVTRQHVVDILRAVRLPELAEEAYRVLPDPVEYNHVARFFLPVRHHQRRSDQPHGRKPVTRDGSAWSRSTMPFRIRWLVLGRLNVRTA